MSGADAAGERCDVLIVGGGPAGAAAAIGLVQAGVSACVLSREKSAARERACEIFPPEVVPLLRALGVWEQFQHQGHMACDGMVSAWGRADAQAKSFFGSAYGSGWLVDRGRFDGLLRARVSDAGAEIIPIASHAQIEPRKAGRWRVQVGARAFAPRLILDATGRGSKLRARLGAVDHVHDQLIGVGRWFKSESDEPRAACALIETCEIGWWFHAATGDGRRLAMLMTDLDLYLDQPKPAAGIWTAALDATDHVRPRICGMQPHGRRRVFMASSHQVVAPGSEGWLPIGDAMQSLDPLSGMGVVAILRNAPLVTAAALEYLAGHEAALDGHLNDMCASFTGYLVERANIYAAETRWRDAQFWRRRLRTQARAETSR